MSHAIASHIRRPCGAFPAVVRQSSLSVKRGYIEVYLYKPSINHLSTLISTSILLTADRLLPGTWTGHVPKADLHRSRLYGLTTLQLHADRFLKTQYFCKTKLKQSETSNSTTIFE